MARQISKRIKITGTIKAQTPLHVGGLGTDPTVDLSLAVDGNNQIYIPGTSLAGAFRNWMEEHEFDIDGLWGFQKADEGHASFIIIDDAIVELPKGAISELRDHVGIDRFLGAASDKTKFDRSILPKGSHFPLQMSIDITKESPLNFDAIEQLLSALKKDGLRLGAAKTRGLGLIKISDLKRLVYNFSSFDGTLSALRLQSAASNGEHYKPQKTIQSQKLHLSIHWEPIGAVMVKSGQDGVAVDILPLTSLHDEQISFVLPGSAIKGALRFQAERILRTALKVPASPKEKLQEQLEHPQLALTQWLFGKSGTGAKTETIDFGRGALTVDDCFCEKHLTPQAWQAVEQAIDNPKDPRSGTLRGSLDAAGLTETQQAFHVAIDRWTGGAADQMLYSALEPFNLQWHPIELTLDLKRIPQEEHTLVQALLLLILRDLAAGRIPLGYGVNRGYGSLKVNHICLKSPASSALQTSELTFSANGAISGIDLTPLNDAWQIWLKQAISEEVAA
jgi:CRISPR/Cas system CSM-associated protein Csm3 (group 7 of RAMP superfamily)